MVKVEAVMAKLRALRWWPAVGPDEWRQAYWELGGRDELSTKHHLYPLIKAQIKVAKRTIKRQGDTRKTE